MAWVNFRAGNGTGSATSKQKSHPFDSAIVGVARRLRKVQRYWI